MLPKTWPRISRKNSSDSLRSFSSLHSVNSITADDRVTTTSDGSICHSDGLIDDQLPVEYFRQDVINMIHRLRIPGWSLVGIDMAMDLDMCRISSALTNSVYSVKPPVYIKDAIKREYSGRPYHHKLPPALLLRVYGSQVGGLIDREKELRVVAELSLHNIGPRLLGTFKNGRFEQFLNAHTLTKEDIRNPDTSIQIAKRMRELHLNVPLKPEDIADGYIVWKHFWNWAPAAKRKLAELEEKNKGTTVRVMQVPSFDVFLDAVRKYQAFLEKKYAKEELVFCHNDTQYGNILRLEPPKGSPLLKPQNEYRQLVVIDFEYSGPNLNYYDIANHFCEWMGDYHHPTMPHHIWTERYPTIEEQRRFVGSYVEHGVSEFDETLIESEIDKILEGVRDWKPATSAIWSIWGIIQTPSESDFEWRQEYLNQKPEYELLSHQPTDESEPENDSNEFDNLSYSMEKFSLFWSDLKNLGII